MSRKWISALLILFVLGSTYSSYAQQNRVDKVKVYRIQVGAYQEVKYFNQTYNKLKANRLPVYSTRGAYYKLYVGDYLSLIEATKALEKIRKLGYDGLIRTTQKTISVKAPPVESKPTSPQVQGNTDATSKVQNDLVEKDSVKNFSFNQDIQIQGVFGGYSFFFFTDNYWEIKDSAYLELVFSQSEITEYKDSTVTVYLNDLPIGSLALNKEAVFRKTERLKLPSNRINKGLNTIKLKTYRRMTDEPCEDDINPANWIVFHNDSYVHLAYSIKKEGIALKDYPFPYIMGNESEPVHTTIVVQDVTSDKQLNAAIKLATDFGRKQPFGSVKIKITPESELTSDDQLNHLIWISDLENLNASFASLLSEEEKKNLQNNALIKEVTSPFHQERKSLLFLSNDSKGLMNAINSMIDSELVSQMQGSSQYIPLGTNSKQTLSVEDPKITLEDLGYGDQSLEGLYMQQAVFGINIPKDRKIKEDASIELFMRYSKMMDFNKSSVAVYLNGVPIGDKALSEEKSENDSVTLTIPKEFRDENYLELKVVFHLVPKEVECDERKNISLWAVLTNDSYIYLPYEIVSRRFLEYYPSPFVQQGQFNDLSIVVPENPNRMELSSIGNIMAYLGQNVKQVNNFNVIVGNAISEEEKHKNLLILGTPKRNAMLYSINENLLIKFNDRLDKFLSNEKVQLLDHYSENVGSIQIIPSPWSTDQSVLIITGTTAESIGWSERYLSSFDTTSQLAGDAVIIDHLGLNKAYYFKESDQNANGEKETKLEHREKINFDTHVDSRKAMIFFVLPISIISIVAIGIVFIMRRNR